MSVPSGTLGERPDGSVRSATAVESASVATLAPVSSPCPLAGGTVHSRLSQRIHRMGRFGMILSSPDHDPTVASGKAT